MVGGFPDGQDEWLVVGSKNGARTHPAWFHNMTKNPDDIWLEVGSRKLKVEGQSLTGQARIDALNRIAAIAPRYRKYQKKTDREIPIVRPTPPTACATTRPRSSQRSAGSAQRRLGSSPSPGEPPNFPPPLAGEGHGGGVITRTNTKE